MSQTAAQQSHKVVPHSEWLAARKDLLAKEKALTRQLDALASERLHLPWEKVEKNYVFDGPNGKQSLADLFAGRSQLIVYHFMFGPDWKEGCPSCSIVGDHLDGSVQHLANRDVTLIAVSRATYPQVEAFQKRMGWKFHWYSSNANDFNRDYNVSFTKEEVAAKNMNYNYNMGFFPSDEGPGASVFYKDESGNIFHTYSAYARGLESIMGVYNFLDIAPKGRDESHLDFSMSWVRHHDRYDQNYFAETSGSSGSAKQASGSCCADHA